MMVNDHAWFELQRVTVGHRAEKTEGFGGLGIKAESTADLIQVLARETPGLDHQHLAWAKLK